MGEAELPLPPNPIQPISYSCRKNAGLPSKSQQSIAGLTKTDQSLDEEKEKLVKEEEEEKGVYVG